ncbi:MAG: response regulator transcription factor, partial [Candidatus Omnitrophota bacterium]|nr:response regulator transcription factor [Candidatus Omnitrophota bacterium]
MLKEDAFDQLLMAIKMILKDKQFISPAISTLMTERYIRSLDDSEAPSVEILTRRELQILRLVAGGHASKNIAEKLKISPRTVETHRANMTNKLGIKTTSRLVKYAIQKGLV